MFCETRSPFLKLPIWALCLLFLNVACDDAAKGRGAQGGDSGFDRSLRDQSVMPDRAVGEPDVQVDRGVVVDLGVDASVLVDVSVLDHGSDMGPNQDAAVRNPGAAATCLADIADENSPGPNYDQFDAPIGTHCRGTNIQNIEGVERVIFLGDSVTNGTPNDEHPLCLDNDHFWRSRLAVWLADRFGLERGNDLEWEQWQSYSCLYNGEPGLVESGDFRNCARWGASTDDFLGDVDLPDEGAARDEFCALCCVGGVCGDENKCIRAAPDPQNDAFCEFESDKSLGECVGGGVQLAEKTLFVFTIGGNNVATITKEGGQHTRDSEEGRREIEEGYPEAWRIARETIVYLEEAIKFMKDPRRFPNGSYVVMGGPFEFTDGTSRVDACRPQSIEIPLIGELDLSALSLDVASLVGFTNWAEPQVLQEITTYLLEQYMRIAMEYGVDYVWVLESFCGHGYVAAGPMADPNNRCYREDDPSLWFDASCTHPNERGHSALYDLFQSVIAE